VGKRRRLEQILKRCPDLENPKRRNFVQAPPPLSVLTTDQADAARYFRKVFDWDLQ
jgi:hypothetical protein